MTQPDREALKAAILARLSAIGAGKAINPQEVAMTIAGKDEKQWSRLMKPLRAAALALAGEGRIVILRKGKPVTDDSFKGVYKIALAGTGDQGDGNS